ncbi:MAG: gliding motility lipoprotein GldD [Paludibacter sp.]|nr:gliding motility lipoprotein GldD [Bacteroidales bacterium]MCM1069420.1 gliding motility lipoprotein GldD [Prevotella sp.]MCM1353795.1 gliding motility lipoprotein GldD [Bacteroides sp.]MCM1442804.1 gliding motility lipoprotein GldD [Muribaculum sp.]MCM1481830.1 gliding motility lipoprotein GldD [Paludibacter sp.]
MKQRLKIFVLLLISATVCSCGKRYVPKPRGYFRIAVPEHRYTTFQPQGFPYSFDISENAKASLRHSPEEQYWLDIVYPAFDARIHCSYKQVDDNLRLLSDDAQRFVYKHAGKATSIPEQGFENPEKHIWGVLYELQGNTASPFQFYLTDSTRHFFRGAVYFNCIPQQDSLAPVIRYMETDVRRLIESFEWRSTSSKS